MKRRAIVTIVLLGVFLATSNLLAAGTPDTCRVIIYPEGDQFVDVGICDTVRIGCPIEALDVVPGDSIAIPFYVFNDLPLSAFSLGFRYNSDYVEITSWSMDGSSIPPGGVQQSLAVPAENRFLTGWLSFNPFDTIPRVTGAEAQLLGTLWMRILPSAPSMTIDIDSVRVGVGGKFMLAPFGGGKISPVYTDCGSEDVIVRMSGCGDANADGEVNIADAVYLLHYIFASGPAPVPVESGDANCDGRINITDAVYLVNFIFSGGPAPCAECK